MEKLAPICLFVYNRPEHAENTLEALRVNTLADESTLYIFSDGPKKNASIEEKNNIDSVRTIIKKKSWCKTVIIEESDVNKGLADSIITGVTKVLKKHGKIIVLEDDIISSKGFLTYMNNALDKYENIANVMQISGFSFPVSKIKKNNSAYFLPLTSTWGWGTWQRVWENVDFDCKQYNPNTLNKHLFNFYNSYNYSSLLHKQLTLSNIGSWGIRFYFNVFISKGLVLFPDKTFVKNIGWDNSGRHKATFELHSSSDWDELNTIEHFPEPIVDENCLKLNINYLKRENSLLIKLIKKLLAFIPIKYPNS